MLKEYILLLYQYYGFSIQQCYRKLHSAVMVVHLSTVSQDGATPLLMASEYVHLKVVDVLLKNGADPNLARQVSAE